MGLNSTDVVVKFFVSFRVRMLSYLYFFEAAMLMLDRANLDKIRLILCSF